MKLALPLFILFEGIDGSGKSTIADMIYRHYISLGIPAVKAMEPTSGRWGKKIKKILSGTAMPQAEEQLRLFIRDREDDVKKNIAPLLKKGNLIIMDRYYYSNAAYQGAMGISPDFIINENRKMGFPEPDRVYLIDINPEEALRRISNRNNNKSGSEIFEKRALLEEVRRIYLSIADEKFHVVNGMLSEEDIFQIVQDDIEINFRI